MFVKQIKKPHGKTSVLIVKSIRKNGKPTHKTIRSLGTATNENELEIIFMTVLNTVP